MGFFKERFHFNNKEYNFRFEQCPRDLFIVVSSRQLRSIERNTETGFETAQTQPVFHVNSVFV